MPMIIMITAMETTPMIAMTRAPSDTDTYKVVDTVSCPVGVPDRVVVGGVLVM